MLLRTVVGLTLLLMIACGGKSTPPPTEPVAKTEPAPAPAEPAASDRSEELLAKIGAFKDQVCACADSECLETAQKAMMDWALANMEEIKALTPTKEQDAKADQYSAEMDECRQRIEASSSSGDDPAFVEELMKQMEAFKNQTCACKDKACVERVEKQVMDWAMANMDKMKNIKPTQAQDEQAGKYADEMEACSARIKK